MNINDNMMVEFMAQDKNALSAQDKQLVQAIRLEREILEEAMKKHYVVRPQKFLEGLDLFNISERTAEISEIVQALISGKFWELSDKDMLAMITQAVPKEGLFKRYEIGQQVQVSATGREGTVLMQKTPGQEADFIIAVVKELKIDTQKDTPNGKRFFYDIPVTALEAKGIDIEKVMSALNGINSGVGAHLHNSTLSGQVIRCNMIAVMDVIHPEQSQEDNEKKWRKIVGKPSSPDRLPSR